MCHYEYVILSWQMWNSGFHAEQCVLSETENPLNWIYMASLKQCSHQAAPNQKPAADGNKRENWQPGFHLQFLLTSLAKKSVHVPPSCVSRINKKGDSAWKWVAETVSSQNGVNFLWWGCLISYVIHVMADRSFSCSLKWPFEFASSAIVFYSFCSLHLCCSATASLWKARLWNTLCDSFSTVAQPVMG